MVLTQHKGHKRKEGQKQFHYALPIGPEVINLFCCTDQKQNYVLYKVLAYFMTKKCLVPWSQTNSQ
jgi:hypothetical protein